MIDFAQSLTQLPCDYFFLLELIDYSTSLIDSLIWLALLTYLINQSIKRSAPINWYLLATSRGVACDYWLVTNPIGLSFRIRPYHAECTRSHPNSEVKLHWAGLVLGWGTTREQSGVVSTILFCCRLAHSFGPALTKVSQSVNQAINEWVGWFNSWMFMWERAIKMYIHWLLFYLWVKKCQCLLKHFPWFGGVIPYSRPYTRKYEVPSSDVMCHHSSSEVLTLV